MLMILLDAVTLVFLLKLVHNEDVGFGTASIIGFGGAIGTSLLALALGMVLGLAGVLIAALIGAAIVGLIVAYMFGIEVKRAMMIGGIFMLVHIGGSIAISAVFRG